MEREQAGASPALSVPFQVDVERMLFNLQHAFDPLHDDYDLDFHIQRVQGGHVVLSIALPEGMLKGFVALLQSLHGFFRFTEMKARVARCEDQAFAPEVVEQRRKNQDRFQNEVCRIFDELIGQGLDAKEAVKGTNRALKAQNHPWASHATIQDVLRASGRFRSARRKGGVKPN